MALFWGTAGGFGVNELAITDVFAQDNLTLTTALTGNGGIRDENFMRPKSGRLSETQSLDAGRAWAIMSVPSCVGRWQLHWRRLPCESPVAANRTANGLRSNGQEQEVLSRFPRQ